MSRKLTSAELKSIREAIGFTSKDMAKLLGVTLNTEIRMEAGIRTVSQRHSDQVQELLKRFDKDVKRVEHESIGIIYVPKNDWDPTGDQSTPSRYQRMVALRAAMETGSILDYKIWLAEK